MKTLKYHQVKDALSKVQIDMLQDNVQEALIPEFTLEDSLLLQQAILCLYFFARNV